MGRRRAAFTARDSTPSLWYVISLSSQAARRYSLITPARIRRGGIARTVPELLAHDVIAGAALAFHAPIPARSPAAPATSGCWQPGTTAAGGNGASTAAAGGRADRRSRAAMEQPSRRTTAHVHSTSTRTKTPTTARCRCGLVMRSSMSCGSNARARRPQTR